MAEKDRARTEAFRILQRIETDGAYSHLSFGTLDDFPPLDAAFARTIVLGVLEKKRLLDAYLAPFLKKEPAPELRLLLREGLYQILFLDRVPDAAACDETVRTARAFFGGPRAGFVNAVLRSAVREKEAGRLPDPATFPPAVRYSVSDGICSLLRTQYPENWEDILEAFGRPQPLRLRCNTLKTDPASLAAALEGETEGTGVRLDPENGHKPDAIRRTEEGLCFPQGYGSQETVRLLGARPGDLVIDVCACPGGKSFGAALDMGNEGTVLSFDLHENKLSAVRKGAERLGLTILKTEARDARTGDPALHGKADRVLCDVPCSGLGEMGAKPEIRYRDPAGFSQLYGTQERILDVSSAYVKKGGVLVYSTCTWNIIENGETVRSFLDAHPEFVRTDEKTFLPTDASREGFYCVRMERKD